MKKTVVITGASGFIGLNLVEVFMRRGWRVRALSFDGIPALAAAEFAVLPGELDDRRGDVRDLAALEALFEGGAPDAVIAGAAITSGAAREREQPSAIFDVNLLAPVRLLEIAARHQVPRMLCFSSTSSMGELPFLGQPVRETDLPRPLTFYGATKSALETVGLRWNSFGAAPRLFVGRLTAAIGPWERATGVRDTLSPPLAIVESALAGVPIAPLPAGGARDYAYAPEVAEQVAWLMTASSPPPQHFLYQLSPGFTWHARAMLDALAAEGVVVRIEEGGRRIEFNDDLTRTRSPLLADRIAQEFRAPPDAAACSRAYARWALAHREWFAR